MAHKKKTFLIQIGHFKMVMNILKLLFTFANAACKFLYSLY